MQAISLFLQSYWVHIVVAGVAVPASLKLLDWLRAKGVEFIHAELEKFRAHVNADPIGAQLAVDDAVIDILESYLPEVIHELDATIQSEIAAGKISSLDWKNLGASLWAKGRAEIETGVTNYMQVSGEKDGKIIAEIVAKKFFLKQSALQKGLIVPH